jgi:hypothetical protein
MTVSPEVHYQKSWAGRIGSAVTRSRHSPVEYTFAGRNAFLRRFLPDDPSLSEKEAHLRAVAARRAYMLQLALKSARVRAKRLEARKGKVARK